MCLGVPGKIVSINETSKDTLSKTGKISFNGAIREINLSYVPEAKEGDYVIVHAGFAISILDENEAQNVFQSFEELEKVYATNEKELGSDGEN